MAGLLIGDTQTVDMRLFHLWLSHDTAQWSFGGDAADLRTRRTGEQASRARAHPCG